MTLFGCADAHGVIAYTGIGLDDSGNTPSEWLIELQRQKNIFDEPLDTVVAAIAEDLARRLKVIRLRYGAKTARHTFLSAAWNRGTNIISRISNYEDAEGNQRLGENAVEVFSNRPNGPDDVRIISSGDHSKREERSAIWGAAISGDVNRVKALSVKAIRDRPFRIGGTGSISASAQWSLIGERRDEDPWYGHGVVGGAAAVEPPNLINIAAKIGMANGWYARIGWAGSVTSDTYVGGDIPTGVISYAANEHPHISEPMCGICGSPWPASHKNCEVCLGKKAIAGGTRRNRHR